MSHTKSGWKLFNSGQFKFSYRVVREGPGEINIEVDKGAAEQFAKGGVDISQLSDIGSRSAHKVLSRLLSPDESDSV